MTEIDHNPHEKRPTNRIWWELLAGIVFCWGVLLFYGMVDWVSALGGVGTGAVLATWALERTGGKTPRILGGQSSDQRS